MVMYEALMNGASSLARKEVQPWITAPFCRHDKNRASVDDRPKGCLENRCITSPVLFF
jgi:hypothetical protein